MFQTNDTSGVTVIYVHTSMRVKRHMKVDYQLYYSSENGACKSDLWGISSIRSQNINLRCRNMADLRRMKLRLQIGIFDINRKSSIQRFAEFNLRLSKYPKKIIFCTIFS